MNMSIVRGRNPRITAVSQLDDLSGHHKDAKAAAYYGLRTLINVPRTRYPMRVNTGLYHRLRRDLVYVIHDVALPNTQILVNREYKPLGSNMLDGWARYEDYPHLRVHLTPKQIAAVCAPCTPGALFDDGCPPWQSPSDAKAYLDRLKRLLDALG